MRRQKIRAPSRFSSGRKTSHQSLPRTCSSSAKPKSSSALALNRTIRPSVSTSRKITGATSTTARVNACSRCTDLEAARELLLEPRPLGEVADDHHHLVVPRRHDARLEVAIFARRCSGDTRSSGRRSRPAARAPPRSDRRRRRGRSSPTLRPIISSRGQDQRLAPAGRLEVRAVARHAEHQVGDRVEQRAAARLAAAGAPGGRGLSSSRAAPRRRPRRAAPAGGGAPRRGRSRRA